MKSENWTSKSCLAEAKKYSSLTEWKAKSSSSYLFALKQGEHRQIAESLNWTRCKRWTQASCLVEAKKHSSMKEWEEASRGSYLFALKQGLQQQIADKNGWKPKK